MYGSEGAILDLTASVVQTASTTDFRGKLRVTCLSTCREAVNNS